jgi:Zn-dependent protease with chaperone function
VDFFERQARIRRTSTRLVALFVLAVVTLTVAMDGIILGQLYLVIDNLHRFAKHSSVDFTRLTIIVTIVTTVLMVVATCAPAWYRTRQLRRGGAVLARELGGHPVPHDTEYTRLRELRDVVEEMSIAAGLPVPTVYLLPGEPGINAFAAGWTAADAVLVVTRGCLDHLDRAELQAVVAHEVSHMLSGDMRVNLRLIGMLHGLDFFGVYGWLGRKLVRPERTTVLVFWALLWLSCCCLPVALPLGIVGGLGVLAVTMIKASLSRQREFLADAAAVQFTRQTSGILGALVKTASNTVGSTLQSRRGARVSHLLFGPASGSADALASHPALFERIRALDPSFDPRLLLPPPPPQPAHPTLPDLVRAPLPRPEPDDLVGQLTELAPPDSTAYRNAVELISEIPADVIDQARNPATAPALILGLLLAEGEDARAQQRAVLAERHGHELADAAWRSSSALAALGPHLRLPLAQLALPALRERSVAERNRVLAQVQLLIHVHHTPSVRERCLSSLVSATITYSIRPDAAPLPGRMKLRMVRAEVVTLLTVMAAAGHSDPIAATQAFQQGLALVLPGERHLFDPIGRTSALESGWHGLATLQPAELAKLIDAVIIVMSTDRDEAATRESAVGEMDLLRTTCALLHYPLPR